MGCVYLATNLINGKRYVGKTMKTLAARRASHIRESSGRKPHYFQRAIYKYGAKNFTWEELFTSDNEDELFQKEIHYIEFYGTYNSEGGYNLTKGGEGQLGYHFSEESRKKMSHCPSEETREKMSESHKQYRKDHPDYDERLTKILVGYNKSPAGRLTAAKSHLGKEFPRETAAKISEALKGKPKSPEHAQKCREASLGVKHSKETIQKRIENLKSRPKTEKEINRDSLWLGKHHTEEAKEKVRQSRLGKPLSEEHKEKLKLAWILRRQRATNKG
jgi:group I intron endonuclease